MLSHASHAQYNFYYGNIHSHTEFTDGNKDSTTSGVHNPAQSYAYAKSSYHIDFWGISEHNHYSFPTNPGMLLPRYAQGLAQADAANQNGTFVAMFGLEWGVISQGGHVVTYGSPGLIGWEQNVGGQAGNNYNIFCPEGDFTTYWAIINAQPNSFCTLAHPQAGDYGDLLGASAYSAHADSAIVGCAIRSGGAFSTTNDYSDPPATLYETEFRQSLYKGYHIGPLIDHDNHYTTFGRTLPGRTVVLSRSLNRDSISAAFRQRRFYASDDWNAQVTFTVGGNIMGTIDTLFTNSAITVSVTDPDPGDVVTNIKIYYGVPGSGSYATILNSNNNSSTISYTHTTVPGNDYYYYAKITQGDGDIIWTSPIWVHRMLSIVPVTLFSFTATPDKNDVQLNWSAANEDLSSVVLEYCADGISFLPLSYFQPQGSTGSTDYYFTHRSPGARFNHYRLKFLHTDGSFSYSNILMAELNNPLADLKIYPNPVHDILNISYASSGNVNAVLAIYDMAGRLVQTQTIALSRNSRNYSVNTRSLPKGSYLLVISQPNIRLADTRFIKD